MPYFRTFKTLSMAAAAASSVTQTSLNVSTSTGAYVLSRSYDVSTDFFSQFKFRDSGYYQSHLGASDPTNGFVNYLTYANATAQGLVAYKGNQIYIGADSTNVVAKGGVGRASVRLEAKDTFDTGLLIADIAHMPGNTCGSWPAFWTYNFKEDPIGEIDIVEGTAYMSQNQNAVSMHTCGTCKFPTLKARPDCDLHANSKCMNPKNGAGCGTNLQAGTFGTLFNSNGGGVFAMLLDSTGVKIWFFARSKIPADITLGTPMPSGSAWGTPTANFPAGSNCNVTKNFVRQTIIINQSFCGDAIDSWRQQANGKCMAQNTTCSAYVAANPSAYTEAYWLFNYIKLYKSA